MSHTKGPWCVIQEGEKCRVGYYVNGDPTDIRTIEGTLENVKRTVECVNACVSLARPDLIPDLLGDLRMLILLACRKPLTTEEEALLDQLSNRLLIAEGVV